MTAPLSFQFIQKAIRNPFEDQKCQDMHIGITCNQKCCMQFLAGCQSVYRMYLVVHLVPFFIFKLKKVKKEPKKQIIKLLIGLAKSMLFAAGSSAGIRRLVCLYTKYFKYNSAMTIPISFLTSYFLLFQSTGRRMQIALYGLNKCLQTSYNVMIRRNYPVHLPYGQGIMYGIALSVICYHYFNNRQAIKDNYLSALDKILGDC